jgi:hypothetical protein
MEDPAEGSARTLEEENQSGAIRSRKKRSDQVEMAVGGKFIFDRFYVRDGSTQVQKQQDNRAEQQWSHFE